MENDKKQNTSGQQEDLPVLEDLPLEDLNDISSEPDKTAADAVSDIPKKVRVFKEEQPGSEQEASHSGPERTRTDAKVPHSDHSQERPRNGKNHTSGQHHKGNGRRRKRKRKLTVNQILMIVILLILVTVIVRLFIWNRGIKIDTTSSTATGFDTEPMDSIVPLNSTDPEAKRANHDDELNILFLGNAPLSDDAGTSDNLTSMIAAKTGANVYNCSIANSFMSAKNASYSSDYPMDAFSFYKLVSLFAAKDTEAYDMAKKDLSPMPSDAQAAVDTLNKLDFSKLDVICIEYDASDFEEQRLPYSDTNSSDVTTYAGALEAGVKLLQSTYPDVRIIVMSPTYAYYLDKDGKKISSFDTKSFVYSLYIYVIHEQDTSYLNNVSFVDNFYGTIYEEIADKYLTDHIHVNVAGRKLLADRFIYALNRFNDYDFSATSSSAATSSAAQ